ncbi:MAG: porin family protein [Chitinophagia bacterium]
MIKKILLAALVVISTNYISAQAKIGLKGGLGFANAKYTSGTYSETYKSIVTPNFGLTLDFKGSESFNIQSGLMYNGMGGKYSYDGGSTRTHLNYLSIPLLAKFKFGEGFHGYAGPQLSFLLSAKYKDEDGTTDIKSELKGSGVFGLFGLGYSLNDKFGLYGEYSAGISNLAKESTGDDKWRANAFSFGINLNF